MRIFIGYLIVLLLLSSCGRRNLAYFSDVYDNNEVAQLLPLVPETKIQPDDILSISVTTINQEANALFNTGEVIEQGSTVDYRNTKSNLYREGYLVDKNGNVDFPVIGLIKLGGLTKIEAKDFLNEKLLKIVKDPIINIRFLNFKITVVGEVNRPDTFTIPSEKITIFQALGMAGDMTAYGKRNNVLVMREDKGALRFKRINLNSKDVLRSTYFYLKPNDIVYVEPVRAKAIQATANTQLLAIATSILTIIVLVVSRI